jgi:hypothetical protein
MIRYKGKNPITQEYCLKIFNSHRDAKKYAHDNLKKYPIYEIKSPEEIEQAKIIKLIIEK